MDRGRPQIRILNKENALAARRSIDLKGGANMEEKEFVVLDPGNADEIITTIICCFYLFAPLRNK